jgi:Eco57I restriction-modification methylase
VPDDLLAPALDGLFRLRGQMIDYRDLSVRHLGTIYERLLAYQLAPSDGGLVLEEAPGRRDSGSYFTPEPIVDLIVERTLDPLLEQRSVEIAAKRLRGDKALDAFLDLKVLDPAMGSGHFLVSAAARIAQFIATDPSYGGNRDLRQIQRLVAERCLYGVDLNPMAVELARLSLWLFTVTDDAPLTFLSNLRVGNSLVGADVDDLLASDVTLFAERLARDAEELLAQTAEIAATPSETGPAVHKKEQNAAAAEALRQPLHDFADEDIAPYFSEPDRMFHWEIEFPEAFLSTEGTLRSDRGFDAVVGNPPYIRIQTLGRELAQWCRDRYETAFGSFDAYMVFIERAVGLLDPEGRLGFIVPNKFLKLDSGTKLRERLADARLLEEIIDFGDAQLFEGATNYTSIVILDVGGHDEFAYRKVRSEQDGIPSPREIEAEVPVGFSIGGLGDDPWLLVSVGEKELLERMTSESLPLSQSTAAIFTGLQTSADSIYILQDRGAQSGGRLVYSKSLDEELLLEPDLLHPLASGAEVERYAFKPLDSLLLFPYRRREDGMGLVTEAELADLPLTARYLHSHEELLRDRESGKMDHDSWYGYVYPKSLGLHDDPKLGVPRLCERLRASVDLDGEVFLDNVDVNGIVPRAQGPTIWTLGCLLNSKLLDFVFKLHSVPFRGSFYSANKQFIAPLPIRLPSANAEKELDALGRRLHESTNALLLEREGFLGWLSDSIGVSISALAGHTKLRQPDMLTPVELIQILRKNRKALAIDPAGRSFGELLNREHESSVLRIAELTTKIGRDEGEVDDAVFDLYEVSARRRALVEAAYSSG